MFRSVLLLLVIFTLTELSFCGEVDEIENIVEEELPTFSSLAGDRCVFDVLEELTHSSVDQIREKAKDIKLNAQRKIAYVEFISEKGKNRDIPKSVFNNENDRMDKTVENAWQALEDLTEATEQDNIYEAVKALRFNFERRVQSLFYEVRMNHKLKFDQKSSIRNKLLNISNQIRSNVLKSWFVRVLNLTFLLIVAYVIKISPVLGGYATNFLGMVASYQGITKQSNPYGLTHQF